MDANKIGFELSRAMNKWLKNSLRAFVTIDAVVTAVNADFTCDIAIQTVPYTGVPIKVLVGTQASVYPVPVINSKCLVTFRDGNRALPQIVDFDQVDKLYIKTNLTQFNDGDKGGLVLVNDLVTRMNLIENQQNTILQTLKGITIASTPFPFAPVFAAINNLQPTTAGEIENPLITQ